MAYCSSPELVGSCPLLVKGSCPSVRASVCLLLLLEAGNVLCEVDKVLGGLFPLVWSSNWVFLALHWKYAPRNWP